MKQSIGIYDSAAIAGSTFADGKLSLNRSIFYILAVVADSSVHMQSKYGVIFPLKGYNL